MNRNGVPQVIITKSEKNLGIALALAFVFGPIGLLYSSVTWGITFIIIGAILDIVILFATLISFGLGLIFAIPFWGIQGLICCIIAYFATKKYNESLYADYTEMQRMPQYAMPQSIPANIPAAGNQAANYTDAAVAAIPQRIASAEHELADTASDEKISDADKQTTQKKKIIKKIPHTAKKLKSRSQQGQNDTIKIIAACLAGCVLTGAGVIAYLLQQGYTSSQPVQPVPSKTDSKNTKKTADLWEYIQIKNSLHSQISALATDINNRVSSGNELRGANDLLQRSISLCTEISAKRDEMTARYSSVYTAQLLRQVFDAELQRAEGLRQGLAAGVSGGDYRPGFKYGGDGYDKFEAIDAKFNAEYWKK